MTEHENRALFHFDPYEQLKVIKNFDDEIVIITKHKIRYILKEYESSLGKREQWITPFTLLLAFITVFVTSNFRDFIFSSETWQAFFLMLSLISVVWLFMSLRNLIKSKHVDEILSDFMNENISQRLAPKVVATHPKNNETLSVSSEGSEILFSVTYDQEMFTKGYAWCTAENLEYPERNPDENAKWINNRTCVVKMKIYPDRAYGIRFNIDKKYEAFRSIDHIPAEECLLQFNTTELVTKKENEAE